MSPRVTLVLAVALALASLVAWLDLQRQGPGGRFSEPLPEEGPATHPDKPLITFAVNDVRRVRIQHRSTQMDFRREDDRWLGIERGDFVDDFLATLANSVELATLQAAREHLAEYGLDPPQGAVELGFRNGSSLRLFIGDPNPAGTGIYVRVGDDGPVVLTGALLRWELEKLGRAIGHAGS